MSYTTQFPATHITLN